MGELRARLSAALLAAMLLIPRAGAGDPKGEACDLCEGRRRVVYIAEKLDAPRCNAWRSGADRVDKDGTIPPPVGGYVLTNQVIARVLDAQALTDLLARRPGLSYDWLDFAPGFVVIHAATVREAIVVMDELFADARLADVSVDMQRPAAHRTLPTDPLFVLQWHLNNTTDALFDVNAEPAWDAGFTGAGVVAGILELSGWQNDHPDLAAAYSADASQPGGAIGAHATSCAGVLGARANNGIMGAGLAYGAALSEQVAGTDCQTGAALAYRNDLNDLKSNSWGPADNGLVTSLAPVVRTAIEQAAATGRDGSGEILLWAAGNGGTGTDRVDYDPYASSRFTIAVGAVGDFDTKPLYSEPGSSLLVVAQSSGNNRSIYTTSSGSSQDFAFGGTSSACPLAAGVVALMLQARPDLSWRDVQHVLLNSARKCDPASATWELSGGDHDISYSYGFGAVDAGAAVSLAQSWTKAAHELSADSGVIAVNAAIPDNNTTGISQTLAVTRDLRIEAVELILNIDSTYIGDLRIELTAPSGLKSLLANTRIDQQDDYTNYVFTSVRHWDERSPGTWTINVSDRAAADLATWVDYRLRIYGTLPCTPDFDSSGAVDLDDLAIVLSGYGLCEGDTGFIAESDHNNDGCTNLSDLGFLLSHYGQTCP